MGGIVYLDKRAVEDAIKCLEESLHSEHLTMFVESRIRRALMRLQGKPVLDNFTGYRDIRKMGL